MKIDTIALLVFWMLYAIVNIVFGLFFFRRGEYAVALIFVAGLIMAGYFLIYMLATYKRVRIDRDALIVKRQFGSPMTIDMSTLNSWKEVQSFTRGMRTRRLTLYFKDNKNMSFNDRDHVEEYESIHHYLRVNLGDKELD